MSPHLHSSTTTPAKSSHYTQQLSSLLLSGQWGEKDVVVPPGSSSSGGGGGAGMGWGEGIRKWGKHTGGATPYLHSLRNLSLNYYSSQPHPSSSTSRPPPNLSHSPSDALRDPDPQAGIVPHHSPSPTNPHFPADQSAGIVPPSSASDQSSRETNHSIVSFPSTTGTSATNTTQTSGVSALSGASGVSGGSSYVHVSTGSEDRRRSMELGDEDGAGGAGGRRSISVPRNGGGVGASSSGLGNAVELGPVVDLHSSGELVGPAQLGFPPHHGEGENSYPASQSQSQGHGQLKDSSSGTTVTPHTLTTTTTPASIPITGSRGYDLSDPSSTRQNPHQQAQGQLEVAGSPTDTLMPRLVAEAGEGERPGSRSTQRAVGAGAGHNPLAMTSSRAPSGVPGSTSSLPANYTSTSTSTSAGPGGFLSASYLDGDLEEERIMDERGGWFVPVGRGGADGREEEVLEGLRGVEGGLKGLGGIAKRANLILLAFHYHTLGRHAEALNILREVDWSAGMDTSAREMGLSLEVQRVDLVRGRCIMGMSLELLGHPEEALEHYTEAVLQFVEIAGITLPFNQTFFAETPSPTRNVTSSFTSFREGHRWASQALVRGTVISARTTDSDRTLRFARTYNVISQLWPATFRVSERAFMLELYLRILHTSKPQHPLQAPGLRTPWLICDIPHSVLTAVKGNYGELWMREAQVAAMGGRDFLAVATTFPRAGQVNWRVRRFVETCVGLWERSGCPISFGKEVVKILWWAIEMTFQSQQVLRHLTRLLQAVGSYTDAKRVFELYVKLVLKARQASQPDNALELKRASIISLDEAPVAGEYGLAEITNHGDTSAELGDELESDDDFIQALLLGTRLLTRTFADPTEAMRYVVLAGEVISQARGPVSPELRSRVQESKGIVRMAMAVTDGDQLQRPKLQAKGIDHLLTATKLAPGNASAQYHLAYARAEARDIPGATSAIRTAIELDPEFVESWHLLALLLTAAKDWKGALRVIEIGIQTWEGNEAELAKASPSAEPISPNANQIGIASRDFAMDTEISESTARGAGAANSSRRFLSPAGLVNVADASLSSAVPPATPSDRLVTMIQLQMTQALLIEKLQGFDNALHKQQESFAFFSSRTGLGRAGGDALNSDANSIRDLGESFVAVTETTPAGVAQINESMLLAAPAIQGDHALSRSSTFSGHQGDHASIKIDDEADTRSVPGRKRFLAKHLHVPGTKKSHTQRSGSDPEKTVAAPVATSRPRAISNGSSIWSRTTTPAHSHYGGSRPPPPPPPMTTTSPSISNRNPAEIRVLANLWLQSAATFRRAGKLEQALAAIQEAEVMDPNNPGVWVQLGQYHVAIGSPQTAIQSLVKSLVIDPNYSPAIVKLAEVYLSLEQADLAHGLLNPLTQSTGWDIPEAWYLLAKVCEAQGGRRERARECLIFALTLEKGRPCRPLQEVVNRWL